MEDVDVVILFFDIQKKNLIYEDEFKILLIMEYFIHK